MSRAAMSSKGGGLVSAGGAAAWAARCCALFTMCVVGYWASSAYLGGVAAGADVKADGSVSTDRLFNWHPILMTLGFGVLMSEALLAYRSPLPVLEPAAPRQQRKLYHFACHSAAAACIGGGLAAVWRSHTLEVPPIPNLYSPHSWLGMAALVMAGLQFSAGLAAYLWPGGSPAARAALSPWHRFAGQAVYLTGLAAAAAGLQEKAAFLQAFGGKGVRSGYIALPALAELGLLLTGLLVMAHQAGPQQQAQAYRPVGDDLDEEGGGQDGGGTL